MEKKEIHVLEYTLILAMIVAALYLSLSTPTGLIVSDKYLYFKEVNSTSTEKKISYKIEFEDYSQTSCSEGILVVTNDSRTVNFTVSGKKYENGFCEKVVIKFDNVIYSKADKKKNETRITYLIYYGKKSDDPANNTNKGVNETINYPPLLVKEIGDITIEYNSSAILNLSDYFFDNETLSFAMNTDENLGIVILNYSLELKPVSYPYNKTHQINATDGQYGIPSNIFIVYAKPPPVFNKTQGNQSDYISNNTVDGPPQNQTSDNSSNQTQDSNYTITPPQNQSLSQPDNSSNQTQDSNYTITPPQ
ncbi:MAG: hypothetical protein QMD85_00225, partial [Candidatus Aenigmarchaeota archaeon]|nr:hypothetical protein [Candidatus Aenigmarchaeota archaeon]MDI6721953.1 hypothetical protein [Candidatus Aenigmarchaeota archaeon]